MRRINYAVLFFLLATTSNAFPDYQIKSNDVRVDTSSFSGLLSGSDNTVQKALEKIDGSAASAYYSWNSITGTTVSLANRNGYVLNNAALTTATLPATAAVGNRYYIVGRGAGGWKVAQNSGQTIYSGNKNTTLGVGGYLASTHNRDAVEILCVSANTEFQVIGSFGNITVN